MIFSEKIEYFHIQLRKKKQFLKKKFLTHQIRHGHLGLNTKSEKRTKKRVKIYKKSYLRPKKRVMKILRVVWKSNTFLETIFEKKIFFGPKVAWSSGSTLYVSKRGIFDF